MDIFFDMVPGCNINKLMILPPNAKPIALEDLPIYSSWVPLLLGLKHINRSLHKTPESVQKEYGQDKWGVLLEKLKTVNNPTVMHADEFFARGSKTSAFYTDGNLCVADSVVVREIYFEFIRSELLSTVAQSTHIVELGAGYGALIFKLAELPFFQKLSYTAAEYTDTGVQCMSLLARHSNLKLEIGHCDLSDLRLSSFNIPEKAVFMTCWTMACLKGFSRATLHEIIRHKPAVVVHIEPIFEHWGDNSLLHLLWKRYSQLNDYNQSMLTALKEYEAEGLIEILEECSNRFGINPLAPVSVVKWRPCAL